MLNKIFDYTCMGCTEYYLTLGVFSLGCVFSPLAGMIHVTRLNKYMMH
jgi:hypothetical protein